jgi:putative transposase
VFIDPMLTFSEHLMRQVSAGMGAELREFNGDRFHIHLLATPPSLALSVLVNRLNGVSSRRLRQQHPPQVRKYLWGRAFLVPALLRCVLRRRTTDRHQAIHRTTEPTN